MRWYPREVSIYPRLALTCTQLNAISFVYSDLSTSQMRSSISRVLAHAIFRPHGQYGPLIVSHSARILSVSGIGREQNGRTSLGGGSLNGRMRISSSALLQDDSDDVPKGKLRDISGKVETNCCAIT